MNESQEKILFELRDRQRRIETRTTQVLEAIGFETYAKRPTWVDGVVHIPSPACGLKDILAVVPADWSPDDEIQVCHRLKRVCGIYVETD